MVEVKITNHFLKIDSLKYFRDGAQYIELGSYGQKKDPIGSKSRLQVQAKVKRKHIANAKVKQEGSIHVDWKNQSKTDVEANADLTIFGYPIKLGAKFTLKKAKSADLKLMQMYMNELALKKMLNQNASGALKYLANEGNDGRIVSAIWVVLEGKLASDIENEFEFSVKDTTESLGLTVSSDKANTQTITLAAGSTFAYRLSKVKKWNKNKTKIEDLEEDYHGMS